MFASCPSVSLGLRRDSRGRRRPSVNTKHDAHRRHSMRIVGGLDKARDRKHVG